MLYHASDKEAQVLQFPSNIFAVRGEGFLSRSGVCALIIVSVLASVSALLCQLPAAAANGAGANDRNLSGVWWAKDYRAGVDPGPTTIVFTRQGRAVYDRTKAGLSDGTIVDLARKDCRPDGVPRIMAAPYPFEIVQTSDRVTLKFEVNNAVRTIAMNMPMPAADQFTREPLGHSFGHWERDTLVVDTVGFTDNNTFIDATGLPHSAQLHVKEYLWVSNGGTQLEYVALVFDPEIYPQVWMQRHTYDRRRDVRIGNYICGGRNRDISHIQGYEAWK